LTAPQGSQGWTENEQCQTDNPPSFQFSVSEFCRQIAAELNVSSQQIEGAVSLLDDGNTIPFIARYRKEVTRGLDERQLRSN
jgi:hypothetical protein